MQRCRCCRSFYYLLRESELLEQGGKMANYDFQSLLSPIDFEHLVRDLLSKDLGIELNAFAEGKDGGVDLRYSMNNEKTIIVQCKRVKNAPSKTVLEKEEKKLSKLKFDKYYFVTSCDLSVYKTDQIKDVFSNWIKGDSNIYDKQRLNKILDENPEILRKHYKLWINSSEILKTIINNHLIERSKALVTDIQTTCKYYVKNDSYDEALKIISENKFLVISGIPGIGKTTLAKLLLLGYLSEGYEVVEIRTVVEGEKMLSLNDDSKQIFYFDDFLGENFLECDVLDGRSYDLVKFIKIIMNRKNKYLVMTTREHILSQAKSKYEKLNCNEFDLLKYSLDLGSYTRKIKSLILYNHLFYSNVGIEHIKAIIDTKAYKKIIDHKNYSPRIIERMTVNLINVNSDKYPETFIDNLDNPLGIWDRVLDRQISEGGRYALYILLSIGRPISLDEFRKALICFEKEVVGEYRVSFRSTDMKKYLKELENCFTSIKFSKDKIRYLDFQNPSIKDYLIDIVKNDVYCLEMLIKSVCYFNQFEYVFKYLCEKHKENEELNKAIFDVFMRKDEEFENSSKISSYTDKKPLEIDKISSLKHHSLSARDKELQEFLIKKFNKIKFEELGYFRQSLYIDFYKSFKDVLTLKFKELFEMVLSNISGVEYIKNFISLKDISPYFRNLVDKNQDVINEKFKIAIRDDVKNANLDIFLDFLIGDLEEERENITNISNININKVIKEIKDKKDVIAEDDSVFKEKGKGLDVTGLIDSIEDFDEDELFKIGMFSEK